MRYLIGTQTKIEAVNRAEAQSRGCLGVTMYWYDTRPTADGQVCLLIDDNKPLPGSTYTEPAWPVDPTE